MVHAELSYPFSIHPIKSECPYLNVFQKSIKIICHAASPLSPSQLYSHFAINMS